MSYNSAVFAAMAGTFVVAGVYGRVPKSVSEAGVYFGSRTALTGAVYGIALGAFKAFELDERTFNVVDAVSKGVAYTPSVITRTADKLCSATGLGAALIFIVSVNAIYTLTQFLFFSDSER